MCKVTSPVWCSHPEIPQQRFGARMSDDESEERIVTRRE